MDGFGRQHRNDGNDLRGFRSNQRNDLLVPRQGCDIECGVECNRYLDGNSRPHRICSAHPGRKCFRKWISVIVVGRASFERRIPRDWLPPRAIARRRNNLGSRERSYSEPLLGHRLDAWIYCDVPHCCGHKHRCRGVDFRKRNDDKCARCNCWPAGNSRHRRFGDTHVERSVG